MREGRRKRERTGSRRKRRKKKKKQMKCGRGSQRTNRKSSRSTNVL